MTNKFKKKLGENLKKARLARGLTQAEVAEIVQISTEAYSRIERGIVAPAAKTLIDLMNLFDLQRDDLLRTRSGTKETPYPKRITAIADMLTRASKERVEAIQKIIKLVLKME